MDTEPAARSNVGSRERGSAEVRCAASLLCLGCLVLAILVWLVSSFAVYMLRPSSMNFSEKSTEWVRTLPFGNWAVDEAEHIYYSDHAPKKGGPQLTKLPSVGLSKTAGRRVATLYPAHTTRRAPGRRPLRRSSPPRCRAKGCGSAPVRRPRETAGARDHVPT